MKKRKPEDRESRHEVTMKLYRAIKREMAAVRQETVALRIQLNRIDAQLSRRRARRQ